MFFDVFFFSNDNATKEVEVKVKVEDPVFIETMF